MEQGALYTKLAMPLAMPIISTLQNLHTLWTPYCFKGRNFSKKTPWGTHKQVNGFQWLLHPINAHPTVQPAFMTS